MPLGEKYEYYFKSYLNKRKQGIKWDELSHLEQAAFKIFTRDHTEGEREDLLELLKDDSDIIKYSDILLDLDSKINLKKILDLPYNSPYTDRNNETVVISDTLRKAYITKTKTMANSDSIVKDYYHKAFALKLLESLEEEIFKKNKTDAINFKEEINPSEISKVINNKSSSYGLSLINLIETHLQNAGFSKDVSDPKNIRFIKDKKVLKHPAKQYVDPSVDKTFQTSYTTNELISLKLLERDIYYRYVMGYIKEEGYNSNGTFVYKYRRKESATTTKNIFSNIPKEVTDMEKVKYHIVSAYNKAFGKKFKNSEVSEDIKVFLKRPPVINYIVDDLHKQLLDFHQSEMEIIIRFILFYEQKHEFSYFPKTKSRTKKNKVTLNTTFSNFYVICQKNGVKSKDLKLIATFTRMNESFIYETLHPNSVKTADFKYNSMLSKTRKIIKSFLNQTKHEYMIGYIAEELNRDSDKTKALIESIKTHI